MVDSWCVFGRGLVCRLWYVIGMKIGTLTTYQRDTTNLACGLCGVGAGWLGGQGLGRWGGLWAVGLGWVGGGWGKVGWGRGSCACRGSVSVVTARAGQLMNYSNLYLILTECHPTQHSDGATSLPVTRPEAARG